MEGARECILELLLKGLSSPRSHTAPWVPSWVWILPSKIRRIVRKSNGLISFYIHHSNPSIILLGILSLLTLYSHGFVAVVVDILWILEIFLFLFEPNTMALTSTHLDQFPTSSLTQKCFRYFKGSFHVVFSKTPKILSFWHLFISRLNIPGAFNLEYFILFC